MSILYLSTIAIALSTSSITPTNSIIEQGHTLKTEVQKIEVLKTAPKFKEFKDVKAKKKAFFDFVYPMVVNANIDILKERQLVSESKSLNSDILSLCKKYRITCEEKIYTKQFLNKVDVIPASLTMAQAANESAWGTSRFAVKANNYFGQWCFTKGCGIVPSKRTSGKGHEVQKFNTVEMSVRSYMHNLNSHPAYEELRNIRLNKMTIDGTKLSHGLINYSERKEEYVKEINSMIRFNKLSKYNDKMKSILIKD